MPTPAITDPTREYLPGGDQLRYTGISFSARILPTSADDISQAFGPEIYEFIGLDASVSAAFSKILTGVLSGDVHVVPKLKATPGRDATPEQKRSQEIADQNRLMLDSLDTPIVDVLREMCRDGLKFGNKLAELVETPALVNGKRTLKSIKPKSWWNWKFGVDPAGNVLGIVPSRGYIGLNYPIPMPTTGNMPGLELGIGPLLDPAHFALLTWDGTGGDPRGNSIQRSVYPWWNEKRQGIPDYRKFMKRFASPKPHFQVPGNASLVPELDANNNPTGNMIDTSVALLRMGQTMDNESVIVTPEGVTLTLIEPKGDGKAYSQFFTFCDQMIYGALLQSARAVMEAEHGSKADATVAQQGTGSLFRFIGAWLGRWVRSILLQYNTLNYGIDDAKAYTPDVMVGEAEHQDQAGLLSAFASVGYKVAPSQYPAMDAQASLPERTETSEEMAAMNAVTQPTAKAEPDGNEPPVEPTKKGEK